MRPFIRRLAAACVAACVAAVSLACGAAANSGYAAHELNAADLGAFLDGYLPIEMDRADVAGATVVVVKDGQVLLARGYGYADMKRKRAVSPETTLFRIGSVSKLFTWMAVMQLIEQGKLDLDTDVQQYLDFPLKPGPEPITLRLLMTHRAGFEETVAGMWAQPGEGMGLRDYLVAQQPASIFAPGSTPAYSNYGATLAGYIVERRSGEAFDAYVERHILRPLGMAHTSFSQPLPVAISAGMSEGYENGSGSAKPFEMIRVGPAGSGSASGLDMARFMIAQLEGGALDGQRVLRADTLALMQSPQWRHHPLGPALTLGPFENAGFGQRVLAHGGDSAWFHSGLYLLPAQRIGIFIVQNSEGRRTLRDPLFRRFLDRYFPAPTAAALNSSEIDASVAGAYMSSRRAESGPLRLASLLEQTTVKVGADGELTTSRARWPNERAIHFRAIGSGVWQNADDASRQLFFRKDAAGRWEMSGRSVVQIEKQVRWYHDARLLKPLLGVSLGFALLSLLAWPMAAAARKHYRSAAVVPRLQNARRALRSAAALMILPCAALGLLLLGSMDDPSTLTSPQFWRGMTAVQAGAWLMLPALALAVWGSVQMWRSAGAWWWSRLHGLLMVLAGCGVLTLAVQGKLLLGL